MSFAVLVRCITHNCHPFSFAVGCCLCFAALPRVEPPSPPGDYLEPAYHVFSAANPTALMASVLTFLHQLQVSCVMSTRLWCLVCGSCLGYALARAHIGEIVKCHNSRLCSALPSSAEECLKRPQNHLNTEQKGVLRQRWSQVTT